MTDEHKNSVAVLIPSYNDEDGLIKSLDSISPEENVDVIVIDDGSIKKPSKLQLESKFNAKGKILLHCLEKNQGIVVALNTGLKIAEQLGYRYIARLDAGDRNIGMRFRQQENFLDSNPDHALVGAWVKFVAPDGNQLFILKHPEKYEEILKSIYRYNPFVHPSVMFRLNAVSEIGGYPDNYPALEDWACFLALCQRHKAANLPDVLLEYEVSPNSISTKKRYIQSRSKVKLLAKEYKFNINQTIGLLKNIVLMILPRSVLTKLKQLLLRRG